MQYVPNRMSSSDSSKQRTGSGSRGRAHCQTPPLDHELEPPKFAKTSLSYMLKNWNVLKSMIVFGCQQTGWKRFAYFYTHTLQCTKQLTMHICRVYFCIILTNKTCWSCVHVYQFVCIRANALDDNVISSSMLQAEEIGKYLDVQNGTSLLDSFVHKLIVKCNGEV